MTEIKPIDKNKKTLTTEKPKAKPAPIENWENEGGNVIPTGTLPKIIFPSKEEDSKDNKGK